MNRIILWTLCLLPLPCALAAQEMADGSRGAFLRRSGAAAGAWLRAAAQQRGDFLLRAWSEVPERAPVPDPLGRSALREGNAPAPTRRPCVPPVPSVSLGALSEEAVAAAWAEISMGAQPLVDYCLEARRRGETCCDWAFLQMADSLSAAVCPGDGNMRELLLGLLLGKAGFMVRFGRGAGALTCLYGVEQVIYGRPYFETDGVRWYRHREGGGPLTLSESVPEGTRPLDLRLTRAPEVSGGPVLSRRVSAAGISFDFRIPQELLDFYGSYPHTEMTVKAGAPVSGWLREGLYPSLRNAVAGMGETEAAGVLLGFVQGLLDYRTDGEQWGFEKWNFPEESLWYPAGDCDDHAILFARLVRDILGLGVVLVECRVDGVPHVTTAVRFTAPPGGDAVSFGGETWWLCEPTSQGARVARRPVGRFEITRIDQVP